MDSTVWDLETSNSFAPLRVSASADVCVVGLGGSGLAAIEEFRARGMEVIGIDAGFIGGGAAGRNGGFLLAGLAMFLHEAVARFGADTVHPLYRETADEIQRMAKRYPEHVRLTGSLRIAVDDAEYEDCLRHLAALRAGGFAGEVYEGPEGRGILIPTDGVFHPRHCLHAQAAELARQGARLHEQTKAISIEPGRVVTPSGKISCDSIVVAVDGGLERIFPSLSPRVRTTRLQMLATQPLAERRFTRAVYFRYGYEYWQQLPGGEIALGGFRDLGGEEEWTFEARPSDRVQSLLTEFLRSQLKVDASVIRRWAASVSYTQDGLPVREEVEKGVWAVGAYSGTGNIIGRLSGKAAARRICGETI